jgi:Zn-dependent protease
VENARVLEDSPLRLLSDDPVAFLMLAVALVFALSLHEYAHALAADLQGDRMPRAMGRLTLNPVKHLDPLGTILIAIAGFGWAKPVQFRPSALASKRFGAAIVALAGPLMNLLLAFAAVFLLVRLRNAGTDLAAAVPTFLYRFFLINTLLAVFNLIPIPPLDGSRLLTIFLPPRRQNVIFFLDQYGMLILFALVFFGSSLIVELTDPVLEFLARLAGA